MITEKSIEEIYNTLTKFKEILFSQADTLAQDKSLLNQAQAKGLADGSITGKNQQMRDASAREVLVELFDEVDTSQVIYDQARLDYELASYEVEKTRLIIRLMEVTKGEMK